MAELILATLAVPEVIVSFVQCGNYIKEKVEQYKQAPSTVIKVGTFGYNLYNGQLKGNLALAQWAYSQEDVDVSMKDVLEDQMERLRVKLIAVDKQLDKCFDKHGDLRRAYFFYPGERNLRSQMKELEQW